MFKKIVLLLFFLQIFTIKGFSQTKDHYYIKKVGFNRNEIGLKNDTVVFLTSQIENNVAKPTIVFLQGSMPIPLIYLMNGEAKTILPFDIKQYSDKFNFVLISRKGIPLVLEYEKYKTGFLDENGKAFQNYENYNNLKYRTNQAKVVIEFLYNQPWVKKESIFVIGHSEGYRVAAKLSENNKIIKKLVCMSADPFNRTAEEIIKERIPCFNQPSDSVFQSNINILLENYKNIGNDIEKYNKNIQLYNWMSYNSELAFESLKKFSNPILVIYGTNDIAVSAHNDLLPFLLRDNNLTIKAYPDLDHNYFKKIYDKRGNLIDESYHWDDVFRDIVKWLLF